MAENPIRYSELIQPDDSIEKLIKQLDQASDAYNNLAGNIRAQSVSISASLKTISGATEQGRASTRAYSQDAERLLKAERELNFARSETAQRIAELNAMKKDEQTITKLTVQLNRSQEGTYEHLAAQYGLNKIRLNAMTEEYRKNTEEGQKLEKETRDIYERMSELQKATGKYSLEVGNYEKAVGQLMGTQNKWLKNLEMLNTLFSGGLSNAIKMAGEQVAVFGKKLLALLANPIVATIAAIAAAFMALAKGISTSEENTRTLERIMAPFERVLNGVLNVLQEMAGWLLRGVEGMEKMAMSLSRLMEKLPIVGSLFENVNNAIAANISLEAARQALEDKERKDLVRNASDALQVAKLRKKAAEETDPAKRERWLKQAIALEDRMMKREKDNAQERYRIAKEKASQSQNDKATNEELARLEADVYNKETQYVQGTIRLQKQLTSSREQQRRAAEQAAKAAQQAAKQRSEAEKQAAEKAKREAEERYKTELDLQRKLEDLRVEANTDTDQQEYAKTVLAYNRQIEDLQHLMETDVAHREQYNEQVLQLETNKANALAALLEKQAKKQEETAQKRVAEEKKAQDAIYKQQLEIIDKRTDLRQLEIDVMEASEYEKNRLSIEAEKQRLKEIYDLNVKAGKDITSLEMQTLQAQMKKLDQEAEKNKKNRDIFDLMGFNLTDEKKEAITTSFDFAIEQLHNYLDAWVQAAEAKAQLAEKEVERAQSVLDAEIEARNQGYASDVETARKELELAKSNEAKALKEKEKAQKAQLALQTVEQAANLITATSLIWSQLGFPWAIPAVAVMWGSFLAAKVKAAEVTKQGTEQYGEGTVELLDGGSHQSGNDVDLGRKPDGTRRRAEGGEFFAVINKRNSRKYRKVIPDIIHSLNAGTFENKYLHAYDGAEGMTVSVQQGGSPDLRGISHDVKAIREQGDRQEYTDGRGRHVVYKNLHRVYKS